MIIHSSTENEMNIVVCLKVRMWHFWQLWMFKVTCFDNEHNATSVSSKRFRDVNIIRSRWNIEKGIWLKIRLTLWTKFHHFFFTYANIQHVKSNHFFLDIDKYWSASVFQHLTDDSTIMDFYPVACDLKCKKFSAAIFL